MANTNFVIFPQVFACVATLGKKSKKPVEHRHDQCLFLSLFLCRDRIETKKYGMPQLYALFFRQTILIHGGEQINRFAARGSITIEHDLDYSHIECLKRQRVPIFFQPDACNLAGNNRHCPWLREAAVSATATVIAFALSLSLPSLSLAYCQSSQNNLVQQDENVPHYLHLRLPTDCEVTDRTKSTCCLHETIDRKACYQKLAAKTGEKIMLHSMVYLSNTSDTAPLRFKEIVSYNQSPNKKQIHNLKINRNYELGDGRITEDTGDLNHTLMAASADLATCAASVFPVPATATATVSSHSWMTFQQLDAKRLFTSTLHHFGVGGFAGAVGAFIVYPLDTIKTRMQAQSPDEGEEMQYKDGLDCFKKLLVEEGPESLYNGLLPQLLCIVPEKALKLTVNEVLLEMLEQAMPGARLWALELIAGGGGGFSQVVVTNPMEIVKVRLQMQSKGISSKDLFQVVKELGLQGLYCGSGITLVRDVPSSSIFFACYSLLRQLNPEEYFWAGFLAAIPATVLVTPVDVIKTRLQMETPPGEESYKDAWDCLQRLLQKEGPRALFKGALLRVLRTCPQFGITLLLYTTVSNGP